MSMQKTLGGDRLGAGKRMKVDLHNYGRSTHNLGYLWRSTMAAGTLVPFMDELALPGDTFDIDLDCNVKTHPTVGPLFGSYKVQLDIFLCPIRLYQSALHNNMLGIGMNMAQIKLPKIQVRVKPTAEGNDVSQQIQVNPSSLMAYLGNMGIGNTSGVIDPQNRKFNAVKHIAYWDIYKNYYANKQEEIGAMISTPLVTDAIQTIDAVAVNGNALNQTPSSNPVLGTVGQTIEFEWLLTQPPAESLVLVTAKGTFRFIDMCPDYTVSGTSYVGTITAGVWATIGAVVFYNWDYITNNQPILSEPEILTFPLENIDEMRQRILASPPLDEFIVPANELTDALTPYTEAYGGDGTGNNYFVANQQGLALKTYQSDLFNNWLSTEWIDGSEGINNITAIDTSGGSFTIDTLNLSKKVYDMLNRIAVSGGSYNDWLDAVYTEERMRLAESPMYMGGLIKELVFQEVVSTSDPQVEGSDPLGTLAGKGIMADKHKGGKVIIKVDEPSYIIGIVSITPRVDYSQGNKWDNHLNTMDDLHKPALDEIGFQDLITEQMAWWDTKYNNSTGQWEQKSAGKQPAWINYMTNYNRTFGNFANPNTGGEMFMTLNRRYEYDNNEYKIKDLTTYIDPSKYNFIFADTALDAQNFWVQIAADIEARRKMSAKIMPNL